MEKIDKLYQQQYKFEQNQLVTPPNLREAMYQQMHEYQLAHPEPTATTPSKNILPILALISALLIAGATYSFLPTTPTNDTQPAYRPYPTEPETSEPLESDQDHTSDEVDEDDDRQEEETLPDVSTQPPVRLPPPRPPVEDGSSIGGPPGNQYEGRFQIIIRPPNNETE